MDGSELSSGSDEDSLASELRLPSPAEAAVPARTQAPRASSAAMTSGSDNPTIFPPFGWNFLNQNGGGGRPTRGERPLVDGLPTDGDVFVRQLIGPPRFTLPYYDDAPYNGRRLHKGLGVGTVFGPVKAVNHTEDDDTRYKRSGRTGWNSGEWAPAGFTSVLVPNPAQYWSRDDLDRVKWEKVHGTLPSPGAHPFVWINVYTTRNIYNKWSELLYCEVGHVSSQQRSVGRMSGERLLHFEMRPIDSTAGWRHASEGYARTES